MLAQVFTIATLVVAGAMLADILAHPAGTKTLIDGIQGVWSTSLSAVQGK